MYNYHIIVIISQCDKIYLHDINCGVLQSITPLRSILRGVIIMILRVVPDYGVDTTTFVGSYGVMNDYSTRFGFINNIMIYISHVI